MFLRISKTEKTGVIIGSIFTSWSEGKTNGPWTVLLKYLAGLRKSSVGEESRKSRAGRAATPTAESFPSPEQNESSRVTPPRRQPGPDAPSGRATPAHPRPPWRLPRPRTPSQTSASPPTARSPGPTAREVTAGWAHQVPRGWTALGAGGVGTRTRDPPGRAPSGNPRSTPGGLRRHPRSPRGGWPCPIEGARSSP